jgi:hypothetical protein
MGDGVKDGTATAEADRVGAGAEVSEAVIPGAERLPLREGANGETIPPSVGMTEIPEGVPVIPFATRTCAALGVTKATQTQRAIIGWNFMTSIVSTAADRRQCRRSHPVHGIGPTL